MQTVCLKMVILQKLIHKSFTISDPEINSPDLYPLKSADASFQA
jgi:hypothetical protein